ncbi:MAG: hypothetical protein R6X14_03610, partial [bacterium]
FRTTDTGASWQRVGAGLAGTVNCIFYSHAIPRVYCGTSDGFYYSTNGGADWRHDGLVEVRSIAAGRLNVLAATRSGVFLNQGQGWVEYSSGLTDLDSYAVSMVHDYYGIFAGTGSAGVFIGLYPVDINEPTRPASPSALRFPTILRGVLNLPAAGMANDQFSMTMLDATGRKVMVLQPGENDVRHQSDFGQGLLRFTLVR